jgi:magnesium transporter
VIGAFEGPIERPVALAMLLTLLLAAAMGVTIPYLRVRLGQVPAIGPSVLIAACTNAGGPCLLRLATLFLF